MSDPLPVVRLFVDTVPTMLDLAKLTADALTDARGVLRHFASRGLEVCSIGVVEDVTSADHGQLHVHAKRLPDDPHQKASRLAALLRGEGAVAL